jgi:prepilin-type N-terminal cleavage/methylation domain-containing protein
MPKTKLLTTQNLHTTTHAFTLLELLIVMAILAGLATIFMTTYPSSQRKARDSRRRNDIKQYQTLMESFASKNNGLYFNTGGSGNVTNYCGPTRFNVTNCPDDPRAPTSRYRINSTSTQYVLWAALEQPAGTYFITCSDTRTGEDTSVPPDSACPL